MIPGGGMLGSKLGISVGLKLRTGGGLVTPGWVSPSSFVVAGLWCLTLLRGEPGVCRGQYILAAGAAPLSNGTWHSQVRLQTAPEAPLSRNLSLRGSELFSDMHGPARLRIAGGAFQQAESVGSLILTGTK